MGEGRPGPPLEGSLSVVAEGQTPNGEMEVRDFLVGELLAFGVMGRTFYSYPEARWIESLQKNEVFQEAPLASGEPDVRKGIELISNWLAGQTPEQAKELLEPDYLRLFVGAGAHILAPPWESVYVSSEPLLLQKETLEVRNWYARYGLEAKNKTHEPDDHAGLELEFLAYLAGLAVEALDAHDQGQFRELVAAQQAFLQEHVLRWIPVWCGHVVEHARTDFFRGAALMTRGLLTWVADHLEPLAEKVSFPGLSSS